MTSPSPHPLRRYLIVQQDWDRRLVKILKETAGDAERQIAKLAGRSGTGALVRTRQLQTALQEINSAMAEAWLRLGDEIAAGRIASAVEAVEVDREWSEGLARAGLPERDATALTSALRASSREAVQLVRTREEISRIELSSRVYRNNVLSSGRVDRLVNSALARGLSARELAKEVAAFIRPDVPGGMSYAAMRLGRTELNNAFHAQTIMDNQDYPWVKYMKWNLSSSHPRPDECDRLARQGAVKGMPGGVYLVEQTPSKPHPHCLCFVTPESISPDQFIKAFRRGEYDGWLTSQGFPR